MKYQKRYKPKTKFEIFLKVYFIIGILVIVLTGVYASVKSMQRKKKWLRKQSSIQLLFLKYLLKKQNGLGKNDLLIVSLSQLRVQKDII